MKTRSIFIVAVDGPAASGKSSICTQVAKNLGWSYLNTGAIYRSIAWLILQRGASSQDPNAFIEAVQEFERHAIWDFNQNSMIYRGALITTQISAEAVGKIASLIAKDATLRNLLLPIQRSLALKAEKAAVLDGRDIGSVVFPDADLKIFMTASLYHRASRRLQQLCKSDEATLERVMKEIELRDLQDSQRDVAPLTRTEDAIEIDTSELDFATTVAKLEEIFLTRYRAMQG